MYGSLPLRDIDLLMRENMARGTGGGGSARAAATERGRRGVCRARRLDPPEKNDAKANAFCRVLFPTVMFR